MSEQLPFEDTNPRYALDALAYYDELAHEGGHDPDVEEFVMEVFEAELGTRSNDEVREMAWLNDKQIKLRLKLGQLATFEMQRRWL